ncbi:hypothetical protein [Aquimarina agarilytica]|uniref:hypothetical protein n=1 Tax=Aquimarina agarilytica TaxID=1087449 RepID=UPI0002FF4664|nr:hypothetical protein [Aquimarina agarilytica]
MDFSNLHFYYLNRFSTDKNTSEILNKTLIKELKDIVTANNIASTKEEDSINNKIAS